METDFAAAVMLLTVAASIVTVAIAKGFSPIRRAATTSAGNDGQSDGASAARDAATSAGEADTRSAHALAHDFFANRRCAICGLAITDPALLHHPPALRGPDGVTVEWSRFAPARLVAALKTHEAVCWNCHVAEEFRRLYPERITDRPEHTPAT